ncbi:MAG: tRNA 2-thiouridine(34) synthase MnmA [Muribaculaceae bacterium]|nr:tRNA 2-thiouridine(34) synthase MnmA [Muribaculaceae bacterium]
MNIAVLISGGVDSAVAVHRLVEQGHTLHLFYIRIGLDVSQGGDCYAEEDIEMCRAIAARYRLPLDIVSLHQEYWDNVMEYAIRAVRDGLTPNPDIMCNRMIKFGFFEERWGHEFNRTATGHYASTLEKDGLIYLATAPDPVKDQTDFLARITYPQLSHLMFPIGDIPKSEVRKIASSLKLPNAFRKDSQGICFLGKINYNDFLRRHLGEKKGAIVEIETGRKIGEHNGFWFHTIGQRKGLGLSGGPWYVVKKNTADNVVYVSRGYDTEKQYGNTLHLDQMHWITKDPWPDDCSGVRITFKNRHSPEFLKGTLTRLDQGEYLIESDTRVQGIAPGQYGVIYDADSRICFGSGVITGRDITSITAP